MPSPAHRPSDLLLRSIILSEINVELIIYFEIGFTDRIETLIVSTYIFYTHSLLILTVIHFD